MVPMDSDVQQTSCNKIRILFVCWGNLCRSPAAAALFEKEISKRGLSSQFYVDSCGMAAWMLGSPIDARMKQALEKRDVIVKPHLAKLFETSFFETFDYIFAADREVLSLLQAKATNDSDKSKIYLACAFSEKFPQEDIPDPYYEKTAVFEKVLDMTEDAVSSILAFFSNKIIY